MTILTKPLLKGVLESSRPHFPAEDMHYFHTLEHAVETAIAHLGSDEADEDALLYAADVAAAIATWSAKHPGEGQQAFANAAAEVSIDGASTGAARIAAYRGKVVEIVRAARAASGDKGDLALDALLQRLCEADSKLRERKAARVAAFLAESFDVADTEIDPVNAERVFREMFPDHPHLTIEGLRPLNGLHSREVHFVDLIDGDWRRQLVIRRDRRENLTPGSVADEYQIMRALFEAGLPIPEPVGASSSPGDLARPFVAMERVDARTLSIADDPAATERMLEIADLLAAFHGVSLESAGFSNDVAEMPLDEHYKTVALPYWEDAWRALGSFDSFTMEWALHYLRNFPQGAGDALRLIHGDYRTRQILADQGKLVALLDFELSGPGSAAEDLACIKPEAERVMPWDQFVARYEASGGVPIAAETLTYFDIFIQFRDLVVVARGQDIYERGQVADLHFGVMGVTWVPMLLDQLQQSLEAVTAPGGVAPKPKSKVTVI